MKKRDTKQPAGRNRFLLIISALLIGSALLRLGSHAGPAIARGLDGAADQATGVPEGGGAGRDAVPEDLRKLIAELQARDRRLRQAEAHMVERMKALELADAALDRRLQDLVQAEESLRETLALADGAAEGDLTRLTGVYERMKPKEAAALFEEMAPEFAAGFLARMRPESAAQVMAGLSPRAAYTISVILAGRNVGVPTE